MLVNWLGKLTFVASPDVLALMTVSFQALTRIVDLDTSDTSGALYSIC
jgi:hypothetical protein